MELWNCNIFFTCVHTDSFQRELLYLISHCFLIPSLSLSWRGVRAWEVYVTMTTVYLCSCVSWSGDYLVFGSESGELHVWEALTFKEVARIKGHSSK